MSTIYALFSNVRSPGNVVSSKFSFVVEVETTYIFRRVWNSQRNEGIINMAKEITFNTRAAIWNESIPTPFNSSYIVMFKATARMRKPSTVVRLVHTVSSKKCNEVHMKRVQVKNPVPRNGVPHVTHEKKKPKKSWVKLARDRWIVHRGVDGNPWGATITFVPTASTCYRNGTDSSRVVGTILSLYWPRNSWFQRCRVTQIRLKSRVLYCTIWHFDRWVLHVAVDRNPWGCTITYVLSDSLCHWNGVDSPPLIDTRLPQNGPRISTGSLSSHFAVVLLCL